MLKAKHNRIKGFIFLTLSMLAIIMIYPNVLHARSFKIAVIPFKINAQKDFDFLKDGIFDMLSSDLSLEGEVSIVAPKAVEALLDKDSAAINEKSAREIGKKLDADYVIFGSVTVLGNSVSIDAKMSDANVVGPPLVVLDQTKKIDEVIKNINIFAREINQKVFNRGPGYPNTAAPVQKTVTKNADSVIDEGGSTDGPFMLVQGGDQSRGQGIWKSMPMKKLINGLSMGDVDGDGSIETVAITSHDVYIYRMENGKLIEEKNIANFNRHSFISVDVADINSNGIAEIFITALNLNKNDVSSIVLEYNGREYKKIGDDHRWYYRVVELKDRGHVLFGQKQGFKHPFSDVIHEMKWQGTTYISEKRIKLPKDVNLMGFTIGDVKNDGREIAVAFAKNDSIFMIDHEAGSSIWKGERKYGGSTLSFALRSGELDDHEDIMYFPMRLMVKDIDLDGKNEVITVNNHEMTKRLFKRFRKYKDTQITVFFWDGTGLAVNRETHMIAGFIRDFAIGDFDNDQKDEIVGVLIIKEKSLSNSLPECAIIAYEIQ